jgi:outer membrane receptor for ferrienterochelin and colicins
MPGLFLAATTPHAKKTMSLRHALLATLIAASVMPVSNEVRAEPVATPPETPRLSESNQLDKVVVRPSSSRDERRESSASKTVVSGEDLTRYGDSNVSDVLKRLPGITINGAAGRDPEIRMRGLGSGYTLVLINGEPTAPGFSIDSISPDLIERIEVSRSAVADRSAQAIAGSINVILKQGVRQTQGDVKAQFTSEGGQPAVSLGGQWADRVDKLSYTLGAEVRRNRYRQDASSLRQTRDAQGWLTEESLVASSSLSSMTSLSLTPRLSWAADAQDTFSAEGFVFRQWQDQAGLEQTETRLGNASLLALTRSDSSRDNQYARGRLNWVRKLEDAAQIEVKLGASQSERRLASVADSLDQALALQRHRAVEAPSSEQTFTLNGKYRAPFMMAHTVSLGWEGEHARRTDLRQQRDATPNGLLAPVNEDDIFKAQLGRLALFVQDEWEPSGQWSIYQGLRWESLKTRSSGLGFDAATSRSSVLSPALQALWKLPDTEGDQVRLALSRTYKAPSTRELSPRRYAASNDNTANSPDYAGNPALRPELAWGLDMAYERYIGNGGVLSASLFARSIQDAVVRQVAFDAGQGLWISRPVNAGRARTHGIELEAKSSARQWFKAAPNVDLRFNLSRNWSSVDSVPGPHNRLAQQTPLSANLGADWRMDGAPLTVGGNFGFIGAGPIAVSAQQLVSSNIKRQLDAYGAWKVDARTQLRLTLSNLWRQDQVDESLYASTDGSTRQLNTSPTDAVIRLALEMKLAP